MPKPAQPKGLEPETPIGRAAGKVIAAKITDVSALAEGGLAGDVDGIHDLRVAVKRLREALRLFRRLQPPGLRRRFLPSVEQLNDSLGLVRDRDVWAGHAGWVLEHVPVSEAFLGSLQAKWAKQREAYLAQLLKLWKSLVKDDGLLEGLGGLAAATAKRDRPDSRWPLDRFAYLAVAERAARVRQQLSEGRRLEEPAILHALRIAVKRLKYSIEPFLTALPALAEPYGPVADVQESVGETHDLDVLLAGMAEHVRELPVGGRRGARRAITVAHEHRGELFAQAMAHIAILDTDDWWRNLVDALD